MHGVRERRAIAPLSLEINSCKFEIIRALNPFFFPLIGPKSNLFVCLFILLYY